MNTPRRSIIVIAAAICLAGSGAAFAAGFGVTFPLDGQQEVPAVNTEAMGTCTLIALDAESLDSDRTAAITCNHDVSMAIGAHIHIGEAGVNGPIEIDLGDPDDIEAIFDLTPENMVRLLAGGLYVNVHSPAHTGGEIRGQIPPPTFPGLQRTRFDLMGDGTGTCALLVDRAGSSGEVYCLHDLEGETTATLTDAEGDELLALGDAESPFLTGFDLTAAQLDALLAGELLLRIDGVDEQAIVGAIDGCFDGPHTLCLQDGRFRVEVTFASSEVAGDAWAVSETADSGLFWFFSPANREMLIKVLDGCGINEHFWVFFAATTNVAFEVTVTDTVTGDVWTSSNALDNPALPVQDTAAFATCP